MQRIISALLALTSEEWQMRKVTIDQLREIIVSDMIDRELGELLDDLS